MSAPLPIPEYPTHLLQYENSAGVQPERVRVRVQRTRQTGPVVYWMQRDQRLRDNYALLQAQTLALHTESPLCVVFNLVPSFLGAGVRHFGFMLRGLRQIESDLSTANVPFLLTTGSPETSIVELLKSLNASCLVTDFSPMRISQQWKAAVESRLPPGVGFHEVDAHNVCPAWQVSQKQEFAARTIRPKIYRVIHKYLEAFPQLTLPHPYAWPRDLPAPSPDWAAAFQALTLDTSVPELRWIFPGERRGLQALRRFLTSKRRFGGYAEQRNDATLRDGASNLSPYLHFGMLSAQRVALETMRAAGVGLRGLFPSGKRQSGAAVFAEELIIRRELSDNFCLFAEDGNYDTFDGAHAWAKKTLNEHRDDPRDTLYTFEQLEQGKTHDKLWNAAQLEMVAYGKMAGYMRMLWAKNIQLWTESPEQAIDFALRLNDKWSLDGRDPNGVCGVMWSICGVHDRAWQETKVRGKVRPMTIAAAKRRFDVSKYIAVNPRTFRDAVSTSMLRPP